VLSVVSCEPWIDWTSSPATHHGFGIRMADEQRVKVFVHPIVLTEHVFYKVRSTVNDTASVPPTITTSSGASRRSSSSMSPGT
jgi:hypothetical protein